MFASCGIIKELNLTFNVIPVFKAEVVEKEQCFSFEYY